MSEKLDVLVIAEALGLCIGPSSLVERLKAAEAVCAALEAWIPVDVQCNVIEREKRLELMDRLQAWRELRDRSAA